MSRKPRRKGKDSRQSSKYKGNEMMIEKVMTAADHAKYDGYFRKQQVATQHANDSERRAAAQEKRMRKNAKRVKDVLV